MFVTVCGWQPDITVKGKGGLLRMPSFSVNSDDLLSRRPWEASCSLGTVFQKHGTAEQLRWEGGVEGLISHALGVCL